MVRRLFSPGCGERDQQQPRMEGRQYISRWSRYHPSPGGVTLRWVPGAVIPGGGDVDRGMVMMYSCGLLAMISWAVVLQKKAHIPTEPSVAVPYRHSLGTVADRHNITLCLHPSGASSTAGPPGVSFHGAAPVEYQRVNLAKSAFLSFPSPAFPREQIIEGNKRGPVLYIAETTSLPPDLGEPGLVDGGREVIYQCLDPPFSPSPRSVSVCFVPRQASFPLTPFCQHKMHLSTLAAVAALPLLHTVLAQGAQGNGKTTRYWDCWSVSPLPFPPHTPQTNPPSIANPPAPGPKRATTPTPSSPATRTTTRSTTAATQSPGATTAATPSCAAASPPGPSATRSRTAGPPSTSRASRSRRGAARATS